VLIGSQPDERLVALARAGHEPAFVAIVERYRRELAAQARRLDSSGRAEDIVQQTFLSAFEALRSGAEVQHLRGWLYQILRHAASRSASKERPADELDSSLRATSSLEDTVESRMLARDLLSGLTRLPTRQREAIVAASIAGHSRAEVSRSMGLTEGAVRQLVHRARATLRTAVTALLPYPLANFLMTASGGTAADGAAEVAVGAGAVSAGGAVIKLGALITSGVFAAAVVTSLPTDHHPKHAPTPASGSFALNHHHAQTALRPFPGSGARSAVGQTELARSSSTTAGRVGLSRHRGPHSAVAGASGSSRGRDGSSGGSTGDGKSNGSPGDSGASTTASTGSPGGPGGGGDTGGPGPSGIGSASSGHGGGSSGDGGGQAPAEVNGQPVATVGGGSGASGSPSASGSGSDGGVVSGGRSSDTTGSSGDSSSPGGTVSSGEGSGSSSGQTTDHGGTSGG
jgi:RNA polymerase sigma factor (sigma-70 family)